MDTIRNRRRTVMAWRQYEESPEILRIKQLSPKALKPAGCRIIVKVRTSIHPSQIPRHGEANDGNNGQNSPPIWFTASFCYSHPEDYGNNDVHDGDEKEHNPP